MSWENLFLKSTGELRTKVEGVADQVAGQRHLIYNYPVGNDAAIYGYPNPPLYPVQGI